MLGKEDVSMNCRSARRRIPLHAGGDPVRGAAELEAHLAACPACRREWEALRAVSRLLGQAGRGESPAARPEFLAGVFRKAAAGVRPLSARPSPWLIPAAAAAGVAAAIALGLLLRDENPAPVLPRPPETGAVVEVPEAPTAPADLPRASFFGFGLPVSGPVEAAIDVVGAVGIASDPSSAEADAQHAYTLGEAEPVGDAELCADF
jgi:hypothetical protein